MDEGPRLQILANASQAFSQAMIDVPGVFERIARHVSEVLRDLCAVRLLSPDGTQFEPPVGLWDTDPRLRELLKETPAVAASEAIGPEILRTGRPIVMARIDPVEVAARIAPSPRRDLVTRLGIHSVMVVPLRSGGQILGIISVARRQSGTPAPFDDGDLALLEALADRAGLAIEQSHSYELVAKSREQLQAIGDSLPVLVSLVDRAERYLFVNATYQKWFGREPGTIVGKTLEAVLGPDTYQAISPHIRRVLTGRPVSFQLRVHDLVGKQRDIEVSYTPYLVDGRVEGFVAFVADVTDRVRMEESLKSAVAVRDEFLSIASHELRTPLAALQLQVEGAQRALCRRQQDEGQRDKALGKLDQAMRQINRLTVLIEGLLNVSRITTGRFRLELEPFDMVALVAEIAERFEEEATRTGSSFTLQLPSSVAGRWDRNRVDQALTNLITNALKYGQGKPIFLGLAADDERVVISVRDEGIGIGADDLERIFGRFERAVSSRNYGGLGLGLYIAGQIVRAHGGAIEVMSEPGQGATFTVTLPRAAGGEPASPEPGAPPSS
jgi:PAS domain S-box-containing protein